MFGLAPARIKYVIVDEYQDVNLLQQTLLEHWLGDRDEICIVGDDYQSIYGFTGASPSYLIEMQRRYGFTTAEIAADNRCQLAVSRSRCFRPGRVSA